MCSTYMVGIYHATQALCGEFFCCISRHLKDTKKIDDDMGGMVEAEALSNINTAIFRFDTRSIKHHYNFKLLTFITVSDSYSCQILKESMKY